MRPKSLVLRQHLPVKSPPLDQYTQDLNKRAMDGNNDPLIGRDREVERVIQILCRRGKNNPF